MHASRLQKCFLYAFCIVSLFSESAEGRKAYPPEEPFPTPVVAGVRTIKLHSELAPTKTTQPTWLEKYVSTMVRLTYNKWTPPSEKTKSTDVHFFIHSDGTFSDFIIARSSGDKLNDLACIEALRKTSGFEKRVPEGIYEVSQTFSVERKKELASLKDSH